MLSTAAQVAGARTAHSRVPPRQPPPERQGLFHPLSLHSAKPGTLVNGDCSRCSLPQILTQVHKAHDHVCVVEEGAILDAGQLGRAAAARSRGQEALAVVGMRRSKRLLPGLGRAGPSPGPGLPPLLVRRPALVVVAGQGVVQIQHKERRGL